MASMNEDSASEYLLQTLESYREIGYEELVSDVGIGDHYSVVSEGVDGSREGYLVSIEIEWETGAKDSLVLAATLSGPSSDGGGVLPELQRENIIIKMP